MGDVAGDVKAEAIDATGGVAVGGKPSLYNGEDVLARAVRQAEFWIFFECGKKPAAVPGVVVDGGGNEIGDVEPGGVIAVLAVGEHVLEKWMGFADVIEHAVENDFEALLMRFGDEVKK